MPSTLVSSLSFLSIQCSVYLHLLRLWSLSVSWEPSIHMVSVACLLALCPRHIHNWSYNSSVSRRKETDIFSYVIVILFHLCYLSTSLESLRASQLSLPSACPLLLLNTIFLIYMWFCSMEEIPFDLGPRELSLLSVICYSQVIGP